MQTPSQHKIGNHPGSPSLSIAPRRNVLSTFSNCRENLSTDPRRTVPPPLVPPPPCMASPRNRACTQKWDRFFK